MSENLNRKILFWGVIGLGLGVRMYYWITKAGFHYPDEIFQYLEPAFWKTNRFGWLPWEYARGVRNWALPGYYGALMQWGEWLGFHGYGLHRLLTLHNVLFSLWLIPLGFRLGKATGDETTAWLLAYFCAVFPVFGYFSPHTLSELPGLLFTTWALVLYAELKRSDSPPAKMFFGTGLALGLAVLTRYTQILFGLVLLVDFLINKNLRRNFWWFLWGGGTVIIFLAALDWITWHYPLQSFVEYVRYNLLEDGASEHGVSPWYFYFKEAWWIRLNGFLPFVLIPLFFLKRKNLVWVLVWLVPLILLSLIKHKEERFILAIWPILGLTAILGLQNVVQKFLGNKKNLAFACWLCIGFGFSFYGVAKLPMRWKAGIFKAQDFIGQQPDATGVLLEDRIHLNGGYTLLNKNIPQVSLSDANNLLAHPLFNYVAVYSPGQIRGLTHNQNFTEIRRFEDVHVFKRIGN